MGIKLVFPPFPYYFVIKILIDKKKRAMMSSEIDEMVPAGAQLSLAGKIYVYLYTKIHMCIF